MNSQTFADLIKEDEFKSIQASGLSERHKEFVVHYLRERNAAEAARLCGYAKPHKHSGFTILERVDVNELVTRIIGARLRRLHVTAKRIEEELARVAFASLGDVITVQVDGTAFLDFSRADADTMAAIRSFSCEVVRQRGGETSTAHQILKMHVHMADKLNALDKLARIHRMIVGSDDAVSVALNIAEAIRAARARAELSTPTKDQSA